MRSKRKFFSKFVRSNNSKISYLSLFEFEERSRLNILHESIRTFAQFWNVKNIEIKFYFSLKITKDILKFFFPFYAVTNLWLPPSFKINSKSFFLFFHTHIHREYRSISLLKLRFQFQCTLSIKLDASTAFQTRLRSYLHSVCFNISEINTPYSILPHAFFNSSFPSFNTFF